MINKTGIKVEDFEAFRKHALEGVEHSMTKADHTYDASACFILAAEQEMLFGLIDGDFMRDAESKDKLSSLMAFQAIKSMADFASFTCLVYMKHEKGSSEEDAYKARAASPYRRLQDDPEAQEMVCVMIITADDTEMHFAPVNRMKGRGVWLGAWEPGPDGAKMSSHFADKLTLSLRLVKHCKKNGLDPKKLLEVFGNATGINDSLIPIDPDNPEPAFAKAKAMKQKGPLTGRINPGN